MANQSTYKLNRQQHTSLLTLLSSYVALSGDRIGMRENLSRIDSLYMREVDRTIDNYRAKQAASRGDPTKFRNVQVPVVMPQVETAVTYQTSVFLQGHPIFGVVADATNMDEALMMDTIIGEQQVRGGWINKIQQTFRDGFKYNLMALECDWATETIFDLGNDGEVSDAKLQEVMWSGNKLRSLDLYNTILDPRVAPADIATDGDFAGYTELVSWIKLNRIFRDLGRTDLCFSGSINTVGNVRHDAVDRAGGCGFGMNYFFPQFRDDVLMMRGQNVSNGWDVFIPNFTLPTGQLQEAYLNTVYQLTTIYARIIPSAHGIKDVAGPHIPQVWKFKVLNGFHIIYAERMTNAHQLLPIVVSQPLDDKMGYQTKSLAENVAPFQEISSALANSTVYSRRRAIADRMLYDPTRVSPSAISTDNPTARIPVKASAFGDDLSKAVHVIPFQDELYQYNSNDIQFFNTLANEVTGQNRASQGQFVKGNKTRTEYVDIMSNARGRDHTVSLSLESTFFTPLKTIIKANILQYQGATTFYNPEERRSVAISPRDLRNAMLQFKVSDGLVPSDKQMDAEALTATLQTLQADPELAGEFNKGELFAYLVKSRGARIDQFRKSKEQIAYEQAMQQWQLAMAGIAQALQKMQELDEETIKQLQQAMPPQPTPEQFGYSPTESPAPVKEVSILESYIAKKEGNQGGGNPNTAVS